MTQLVEGLASLIVNNLTIRRWLFKIDDQSHGRGIGDLCNCLRSHDNELRQLIVMLLNTSSAIHGH